MADSVLAFLSTHTPTDQIPPQEIDSLISAAWTLKNMSSDERNVEILVEGGVVAVVCGVLEGVLGVWLYCVEFDKGIDGKLNRFPIRWIYRRVVMSNWVMLFSCWCR